MTKEIISTTNAPQAIGPYSQAVKIGGFVYTAGQIAINPETSQIVEGDVTAQAEQVMKNLEAVLEAAGTSLGNVVKTTIFLRFMKDFSSVNEVYGKFFGAGKPARSTVAVSALPLKALVEIEAVALVPEGAGAEDPAVEKKGAKKKKKAKGKKKK
ncbi:MAG: RidA family protein [Chloroflexota bacterium]|nr:MAG: RidA family protein [Chloroflexota bacterium]